MTQIGFIGLGNMGLHMATNLKKAGHEVSGFDMSTEALSAAEAAGVAPANSAADTAKNASIVITMLPNGAIAKSVAEEVLPAMQDKAVLIDCSTIDVETSREIHTLADASGQLSLDAPVSGGVGGAQAGTLTFMVGGSVDAFKAGLFAFDVMGQKAVHCGDGGAGQAAKICNNMLLGISMIGASEAFNLAESLGLSKEALFDVISTSSGSCWSVNTYCPVPGTGPQSPADNDYDPGFAVSLMLKDLKLSQEASSSSGANTPLGQHATNLYQDMFDADMGGKDFSGIIQYLKNS